MCEACTKGYPLLNEFVKYRNTKNQCSQNYHLQVWFEMVLITSSHFHQFKNNPGKEKRGKGGIYINTVSANLMLMTNSVNPLIISAVNCYRVPRNVIS